MIAAVGEGRHRPDRGREPRARPRARLPDPTSARRSPCAARSPSAGECAGRIRSCSPLSTSTSTRSTAALFFNVVYQKYFENPIRMRRLREGRVDHERAGRLSPWDGLVKREAAAHGFDWPLIVAQMYQESRFDPRARSPAGANRVDAVAAAYGAGVRSRESARFRSSRYELGSPISRGCTPASNPSSRSRTGSGLRSPRTTPDSDT